MDKAILRIPTGPQYSFIELQIEADGLDALQVKVDSLSNKLFATLALATEVGCQVAKQSPDELIKLVNGESTPDEPVNDEQYAEAAVAMVARELGATVVSDAPWDQSVPEETRPAPPWAAAPTPVKSAPVGFEDF